MIPRPTGWTCWTTSSARRQFALKVAEFELEQANAALVQVTGNSPESGQPIDIHAPVSGYVLNVFEESARPVTPGLPIMEVGDPKDLEAEIETPIQRRGQREAGRGCLHRTMGRRRTAAPGKSCWSSLARSSSKISALGVEEQRVKVRVSFSDLPDGLLGDRYRVEARIVTWTGDNILQIPTGALFHRGDEWMAFAVEGGLAKLTESRNRSPATASPPKSPTGSPRDRKSSSTLRTPSATESRSNRGDRFISASRSRTWQGSGFQDISLTASTRAGDRPPFL